MLAQVNDLIRYLGESGLGEAELIYDSDLNRMLDPYRQTYPLAHRCPRARCRTTLAFWALASEGARVVPGPKRRERKGRVAGVYPTMTDPLDLRRPPIQDTRIVGGAADLMFPDLEFTHQKEQAIEWAERGDGLIRSDSNPEIGSGWPLRWTFTCAKCGTPYEYTNSTMLELFLHALYARRGEIRPGRMV